MFNKKYLIIIIALIFFWMGVLPVFLTKAVKVVCANISENSNYEISVVNPNVKLYPLPVVKLNADSVKITSHKTVFASEVSGFSVKIRILPLLGGKLHVNKLFADKLILKTELKKDAELDKHFFEKLKTSGIVCDNVSIKNINAQLVSGNEDPSIIYDSKDFVFEHKNRYNRLKTDSFLSFGDDISKIYLNFYLPKNNNINKTIFDVKVDNLDIKPLGTYFKNFLPENITELSGKINIVADKDEFNVELNNIKATHKEDVLSVKFPDSVKIKSKFSITNDFLKVDSAEINSENIHLLLKGFVKDYFGKTMPTLDLKIIVNKSNVEDFVDILPPFEIEELNTYKLKKYRFYGNILANLSVKGRLPEPDFNGEVYINNGILIKPIPNAKSGATIKISLLGKTAKFDVNVPAGGNERVWVEGFQELYNMKYADMNIKSSSHISLPVAEAVVNPLHEILNFIVGPVPILDITAGYGNIDINVKGNRKTPHVWGELNFNNASADFIEMSDLKLTDADAVLTFNNQNAVWQTKKGLLNGMPLKLNGICDLNGKFDFDVSSQKQPTMSLYNALLTSTMIPDIKNILPEVDKINGTTDFDLKVYGAVKNIEDLSFNKNVFARGTINLDNNNINIQGLDVKDANGVIKLDGLNANADIKATLLESPLSITAKVRNDITDATVNIPKINPNFIINNNDLRGKQYLPYMSVIAKYKGNINNIEYDKLNFKSKIIEPNKLSPFKFQSGEIALKDNVLNLKNITGYIDEPKSSYFADIKVDKVFSNRPIFTGAYKFVTPNLQVLNQVFSEESLPENIRKSLKNYHFSSGSVDLSGKIVDNKITLDSDIDGISLTYIPLELPVEILNGKLSIRNNNAKLSKINMLADNMPIFADGEIRDILSKRYFDFYVNSKPNQKFIDKYINKNQIYPLKIKGDIGYMLYLKGVSNNYDLKLKADMSRESSIYYYGATIGDVENSIRLNLDSKVMNHNLRINEFAYDKLINSQSGKQTRLNMLKAHGGINLLKDDFEFKDFYIKTSHPTDARVFNIIFGKPNIKQGQFTSNLKFNGQMSNPRILGDFHIFETDIPFVDTTMKNIELEFDDKHITIKSKGEVLGSDVSMNAVLKNKLTKPYHIIKADIYTKDMDLNHVADKLKLAQIDNHLGLETFNAFDINSVIASNIKLKADNIQLRNINATNFTANTSITPQKVFDMKNVTFNIAQGTLSGNYKYNLNNNNIDIMLNADKINANDIIWALFDLRNQIYGDLTGSINMSCNGITFESCMQTINGNSTFNVTDGRMPKLGSLEYLLKAGNLVKGGITSLSINSVIDLITPMKTGEFSNIYGKINIKDGIAHDIEIATQGKDLSLFIDGTYNFATSQADMEVFGLLSRKISTLLGPVGNFSVNTLFNVIPGVDLSKDSEILARINKIPGIEFSGKAYRKFIAEIKGNINGEDYVSSFKWIN